MKLWNIVFVLLEREHLVNAPSNTFLKRWSKTNIVNVQRNLEGLNCEKYEWNMEWNKIRTVIVCQTLIVYSSELVIIVMTEHIAQ